MKTTLCWYVSEYQVHLFHRVIFDDLIVCLAVGIYCYFVWKQLQITIHLHVIHFGKPLRSKKKKIVVFVKSDLECICAYISMCFSLYICNCIVRQDLFHNYFIRVFWFFLIPFKFIPCSKYCLYLSFMHSKLKIDYWYMQILNYSLYENHFFWLPAWT